jgi:hypothetical protein
MQKSEHGIDTPVRDERRTFGMGTLRKKELGDDERKMTPERIGKLD